MFYAYGRVGLSMLHADTRMDGTSDTMPVILSIVASNITLRDSKTLFSPLWTGVTWSQYETLSATLDWVTIEGR
jgi:hypothetical protein